MPIAKQKAEAKGPPPAKVEKPKVEAPKPEPKKVYPPMIGFTMTNLDGLDESGLVPAPKGRLNNLLAQERKVNRFVLPMEWNRPFRRVTNWTRGYQGMPGPPRSRLLATNFFDDHFDSGDEGSKISADATPNPSANEVTSFSATWTSRGQKPTPQQAAARLAAENNLEMDVVDEPLSDDQINR